MTSPKVCPYCEISLVEVDRPYVQSGTYLGKFKVRFCNYCKRSFHSQETSIAIEAAAKRLNVWGNTQGIVQPVASTSESTTSGGGIIKVLGEGAISWIQSGETAEAEPTYDVDSITSQEPKSTESTV